MPEAKQIMPIHESITLLLCTINLLERPAKVIPLSHAGGKLSVTGHRKRGRYANFKTLQQSRKLLVQLRPHAGDPRVPKTGKLGTRLVDTEPNGTVWISDKGSSQWRIEHHRSIVTVHTFGHSMVSHQILRTPSLVACETHHRSHIISPIDYEIVRRVLRRRRKNGVPVGITSLKFLKARLVQRRHRRFVALPEIFIRNADDINLQSSHLVYDRWSAFEFLRHHAPLARSPR